jgi:lipoate-protein ligase A
LNYKNEVDRQDALVRLLNRATTVETVLGMKVNRETAAQAFVEAFRDEFGLRFEQGELSKNEQDRAIELVNFKYSQQEWTRRV